MMLSLAILAAATLPAAAAPGCMDVRSANAAVSFEGRLERGTYTTPGAGTGQPESAYILTLDRAICIDDGGEFADPDQSFNRVHLFTSNDRIRPRLRAAVGRRVRITGSGFAAHTAHHHAPLVVDVGSISVAGR